MDLLKARPDVTDGHEMHIAMLRGFITSGADTAADLMAMTLPDLMDSIANCGIYHGVLATLRMVLLKLRSCFFVEAGLENEALRGKLALTCTSWNDTLTLGSPLVSSQQVFRRKLAQEMDICFARLLTAKGREPLIAVINMGCSIISHGTPWDSISMMSQWMFVLAMVAVASRSTSSSLLTFKWRQTWLLFGLTGCVSWNYYRLGLYLSQWLVVTPMISLVS
jgi:hypothetical protein